MSMLARLLLLAAVLLLSLACPPTPWDGPGDHFPPYLPPPAYRTMNMSAKAYSTSSASGIWTCTVEERNMALVATKDALAVLDMPYPASYPYDQRMSQLASIPGPTQGQGGVLRDVETFGTYAYVASNARGFREGVMVVALSPTSPYATYVRSILPQDGLPEVGNLSIQSDKGWLLLARTEGVEVWDIAKDPARPAYLASFASGVPVSDLVVQGTRAYLAEGTARSFSVWDLSSLETPRLVTRWSAGAFAQCIWPSEDGRTLVTIQEVTSAPVQVHRWREEELVPIAFFAEDGKLASSVKVRNGLAYVAFGERGLVVLSLRDPRQPSVVGRWDGESAITTTLANRLWDVMPVPGRQEVLCTDRDQGVFWLSEKF